MARATNDPGELLTVPEVAHRAKVSTKTIRRAIDRLEIGVTRVGTAVRISEASYREWVRRITTDPVL